MQERFIVSAKDIQAHLLFSAEQIETMAAVIRDYGQYSGRN